MSVLQDQCPYKPFPIIRRIIEEEYNQPLEDIFETFDPTPIGSASIGQVHRATLKGRGGQKVVVKVQYPEVERLFRGDVRTIKMFAQVAQPGRKTNYVDTGTDTDTDTDNDTPNYFLIIY